MTIINCISEGSAVFVISDSETCCQCCKLTCLIQEILEGSAPALGEGSDHPSHALTENLSPVSGNGENPRMPPLNKDNSAPNYLKAGEKQIENGDQQEKKTTLKKPDKILPCPRCNSMETKFCYYNNYNVSQPRHFCKNCQRYWTAGGTMRNVPVGAGRRKSKSSSASSIGQCHHSTIAEVPQSARLNVLSGFMFGSGMQLCKSMSSVLNLTGKTFILDRFGKPDAAVVPTSYANLETVFYHPGNSGKNRPTVHGVTMRPPAFPSPVSCFPRARWPSPWGTSFHLPPVLCPPPGFPMPINPVAATAPSAAYWGCAVPSNWSVVTCLPQSPSPNTSAFTNPSSSKNSLALGKHPREESMLKQTSFEEVDELDISEWCLRIPKTLRIDDPGEAAKSSTWAPVGINKNDTKADSVTRATLFDAFQTKVQDETHFTMTPPALQANPAALLRSVNFLESS